MNSSQSARRDFLQLLGGTAGAAWLSAQWPGVLVAAQHAHNAVKAKQPAAFEVLTADQARELDALTACLIPTDDSPGAREAGVVYFLDRALKTFAAEDLPTYKKGLDAVQQFTGELFPGVPRFSAANPEQQIKILTELTADSDLQKGVPRRGLPPGTTDFIQTLRFQTIIGFLVDPSGGGNREFAGWKAIGRDPAYSFTAPFGFYDKDYPGWQAAPGGTEKK
ncbi:MAG TPA: gluconate 2-dehydrogenase subunit 3 family protein [Candidatus Acidoferrum sp.]|nr:gluconate 2-dehydrogenase subunit 3 family protein [Candidatus Acidoferrum sp.]